MQYLGVFWCADIPATRYSGTLKASAEEGFLLELIVPKETELPGNLCRHGITINGVVQDGRRINLLECYYRGESHSDLMDVYRIDVRTAIHGLHIENPKSKVIRSFQVTLDGFGHWFGKPGFVIEHEKGYDSATSVRHAGTTENIYKMDFGTLSTSRSLGPYPESMFHKPITLREWFGYEFESKDLLSVADAISIKARWDAFFCFASFNLLPPPKVYFLTDDSYESGNRAGQLLSSPRDDSKIEKR